MVSSIQNRDRAVDSICLKTLNQLMKVVLQSDDVNMHKYLIDGVCRKLTEMKEYHVLFN